MITSSTEAPSKSTFSPIPERKEENSKQLKALAERLLNDYGNENSTPPLPPELGKTLAHLRPELLQAIEDRTSAKKVARICQHLAKQHKDHLHPDFQLLAAVQPLIDHKHFKTLLKEVMRDGGALRFLRIIMRSKLGAAAAVKTAIGIYGVPAIKKADEELSHNLLCYATETGRGDVVEACAPLYQNPKELATLSEGTWYPGTPLTACAHDDRIDAFRACISLFKQVNPRILLCSEQDSSLLLRPLKQAVQLGQCKIVQEIGAILRDFSPKTLTHMLTQLRRGESFLMDILSVSPIPPEGIRALFGLLKGQTPEVRAKLLGENDEGQTALHQAADFNEDVMPILIDEMTPKELARCMQLDSYGTTPLDQAATNGDLQYLRGLVTQISEKLGYSPLTRKEDGARLFFYTSLSGKADCMRWVFNLIGKEAQALALQVDNKGLTPLHSTVYEGDAESATIIIELMKQRGSQCLEAALKADKRGRTPLHYAVAGGNFQGMQLILELMKEHGGTGLTEAYQADSDGCTFLHLAVDEGNQNCIDAVIKALKASGTEAVRLAFRADNEGETPLHLAAGRERLKPLQEMIALLQTCDKATEESALEPNLEGQTPLHRALGCGFMEGAQALVNYLNTASQKARIAALSPCDDGHYPLRKLVYRKGVDEDALGKLFDSLPSAWHIAKSCPSPKIFEDQTIQSFLIKRFPNSYHRLKLMLTVQYLTNRGLAQSMTDDALRKVKEFLGAAVKSPLTRLLFPHSVSDLKSHYPKVHKLLQRKTRLLLRSIEKEENPVREKELRRQLVILREWRIRLITALMIADTCDQDVAALCPLFKRMENLADADLRTELTTLLVRHSIPNAKSQSIIGPWIKTAAAEKKSALHLLMLAAFTMKGVEPKLLAALHQKTIKCSRALHEGSDHGKLFLRSLIALANTEELDAADTGFLIRQMLENDLLRTTRSIGQIISMGQSKRIQTGALAYTNPDLEAIALDCFRDLIPIKTIKSFQELYQEKISSQRSPDSLLTYASRICRLKSTRQELADWLDSVLDGSWRSKRYAEDNCKHQTTLYRLAPRLREKLPLICQEMGTLILGAETSERKATPFPFGRAKIEEKIKDGHLDLKRFPHLSQFLSAHESEALELRKQLGKAASEAARKKKGNTDEQAQIPGLELWFQLRLVSLCIHTDQRMLRVELKKAFELAVRLRRMGAGIGEFESDLKGALDSINKAFSSVDGFEVSLTDHYWDLLLIGSDVNGSCMRVNGQPEHNQCLTGYMLNGKDFPIVVRKPGSQRIVARRFLRIEIDKERQKPALFLERLYSNYSADEIDAGIIEMAKRVADHLQLPLYTKSLEGKETDVTLLSLDSAASNCYSDALHRETDGTYEVKRPKLLYDPCQWQADESQASCSYGK